MARTNGARQFGAFVEPEGMCLLEYRRERDGITVLGEHLDRRPLHGLADAGDRLGGAIRSAGADEAQISVAIRGFGSAYQIMLLPAAPSAVLGPVVRREMARLNPDMEDPRIDYVLHGDVDRRTRMRSEGGQPPQEVLVAAAPAPGLMEFGEELMDVSVRLHHVTVLPQVIQRLYDEAALSPDPTACYIGLPGGPIITFFYEGLLRLVVEPFAREQEDVAERAQGIVEHLDRGNLFLRQKFRGAELNRLLVSADPAQAAALLEELRKQLEYEVMEFPGPAGSTGALVSLGAVLDGDGAGGLNLSPFAESADAIKAKAGRRKLMFAAGLVIVLAVAWALFSVTSALDKGKQVEHLNTVARARLTALEPMRSIAEQRKKYAESVDYLAKLRLDRAAVERIMAGIVRATPPGMQLGSIGIDRSGAEWSVAVSGTVLGESGADVLLGIDRFFHGLPRQIALHDLVLADLQDVSGGMRFRLSFVSAGKQP